MTDQTTRPTPGAARPKRSLFELLGSLPDQVRELVQREIDLVKAEVIEKVKAIGTGAGLLVGAAIVAVLFVGVLLSLAIIGLSYVLPAWAAALIVAGVLLIVAIVLALLGKRKLDQGLPPVPTESIESIRKDVSAVTGRGKRGM
ncbi:MULTISPECIES: phage holin family protein [unclassified Salinibacterium]|uniref:phage holin family protein n=1 Tax=unclassified Salinibacterium TaxID=2632331 RepID=UPI001424A44F|nr:MULTISPECIES: phage holin family protein [unclassified Salinibacterium]